MHDPTARPHAAERGSGLLLALLIGGALALIGIALALHADLERRCAARADHTQQARRAALAGTRLVAAWFDRPGEAPSFPPAAVVDRSRRRIDIDGAGPAGAVTGPAYKAGVDRDGDGDDDLFDRPYRGDPRDSLLGTADGPDVRIDVTSAGAWLDATTVALLGAPSESGTRVRLVRIDVAAPPFVDGSAGWRPTGLATIEVTAEVLPTSGPPGRVLARARARTVIAAMPDPGIVAAVHAGGGVALDAAGEVGWGALAVVCPGAVCDAADLDPAVLELGLPRGWCGDPSVDPLWPASFAATLDSWLAVSSGSVVDDPWLRVVVDGRLAAAPAAAWPYPSPWAGWSSANPVPTPCCDRSGLSQDAAALPSPAIDYAVLRAAARGAAAHGRYFSWVDTDRFREMGRGGARHFAEIVDRAEGLLFFDTADGRAPRPDGSNLSDAIDVADSGWSVRGFVVAHASAVRISAAGRDTVVRSPPAPWIDLDGDGQPEAGEPSIGLLAPASVGGGWTLASPAGSPAARGPGMIAPVSVDGVLWNAGGMSLTGPARVYGALASPGRIELRTVSGTSPQVLWNADLAGPWPPAGWPLPRIVILGTRVVDAGSAAGASP